MAITVLIGIDFGGIAADNKTDFDPFVVRLGFSNWGALMQFQNTRIKLILGTEKIRFMGEKCIGCRMCWDICPVGVYNMDKEQKKSVMMHAAKCTACSACVVQCPTGALYLEDISSRGSR